MGFRILCLLCPGFPQGFLQAALGFHKYPCLWFNIFVILLWVSTGVSSLCCDILWIWYTVLRVCTSAGMIDASVNMGLRVSCGLPAGFHSVPAGFLRVSRGVLLGFLQVSCEFPVVCLLSSNGFPLSFPWVSYGFPAVCLPVSCGFPAGCLPVSCGFLVGFLRLSHGILAGFLQVSRGFPIQEPMISGAHLKGHIRYLKMDQNRGRRTWT